MGLDYSEALAMRDAARPHAHALGHTANELRYSRTAMWAREHVASGGLGAVEHVEVRVHGAGEMKGEPEHTGVVWGKRRERDC
jgi:predicted dehydrogenase